MKRTPIRRRTPLRAFGVLVGSTGLERKRIKRKPRRARPDKDDPPYIAWVRTCPCCAPDCDRRGPSDPHHKTGAGMGLRAHDHQAIPLCRKCHDAIDAFRGPFKGWTREQRAQWQDDQIRVHRIVYAKHLLAGLQ